MATIKAIESRSVHQIQSGQVIVDLTSVVKELVENSLDAGATSIEVRFKNHGLDCIEVLDNGKGIAPEDFETIALKHYTSKLSSYEDLTGLDTFGFRGEALSSLCALSKFHIVTARSEDGAVGRKLEFETSGTLKGTSVVAAQRGTTVSVENLFCNLPVRRKELEKNIKREYAKVIGHLHAYACVSVGVRFAISNQMPKGKKVAVFATKSNTSTKENITNIFGAKTLLALVQLDLHLEMEPSTGPLLQGARNSSAQANDRSKEVQIQGHISKPVFGEGRQAPDRQMFFVNSRPCGLPQISKAFNEVYKSFNVSQSPFIFANLVMDTNAYDVNVSPDKRSIMLHDQTALIESLKSALTELFESTDQTMPQSQLSKKRLPTFRPPNVTRRASAEDHPAVGEERSDAGDSEGEESFAESTGAPQRKLSVNGTPQSLIQNWVGRNSEQRKEIPVTKKKEASTKDKQNLVNNMKARVAFDETGATAKPPADQQSSNDSSQEKSESDQSMEAVDYEQANMAEVGDAPARDHAPESTGSHYDEFLSQRPTSLPRPVQDFNAVMDRMQRPAAIALSENQATRMHSPTAAEEAGQQGVIKNARSAPEAQASQEVELESDAPLQQPQTEPDIPAMAPSSHKTTPGPVQNAFDRMRSKRTPLQTAEITIGDKTTTTVIGSDSPFKRRRIHRPEDPQAIAKFGGSPLVARGLQSFAAPGSQMQMQLGSSQELAPLPRRSSSVDDEAGDVDSANGIPAAQPALKRKHIRGRMSRASDSDVSTTENLDSLVPASAGEDESDGDYVDEEEKKNQEDETITRLIQGAELVATQPTEGNVRRASQVLKNRGNRKEATLNLACYVETILDEVVEQAKRTLALDVAEDSPMNDGDAPIRRELDEGGAESRLSLTVSKVDFERMRTIGQFNLGFVLAVRPASDGQNEDELFIIDQHAADEKYNYERLQRTVTLQNQRLVRPKPLDLTAIEQEIILSHEDALKANGFEIELTSTEEDDGSTIRRGCLLTLPMAGEKTFDISDLEELLHLLSEAPAGSSEIPRPKKVQKVLAMRACRSSIMVGKTLTVKQMRKVVRHMGEMEKPWNCPHGRPTMRHLAGLTAWQGWREGEVIDEDDKHGESMGGRAADWKAFLAKH